MNINRLLLYGGTYLFGAIAGACIAAPPGGFVSWLMHGQLAPLEGWEYHLVGGTAFFLLVVGVALGVWLSHRALQRYLEGESANPDQPQPN